MKNNLKIKIILVILCIGLISGIISHVFFKNHMLYWPSDYSFPDYRSTIVVTDNVYDNISIGRGYFPTTYIFLKVIKAVFDINIAGYILSFSIFTIALIKFLEIYLENSTKKIYIIIFMLLFSYPFLFEFDRANVEYIVMSFLLIFFILYKKEKYTLASLALAVPICMKLYPALFAILLLKRKKYKEFLLCTVLSLSLMLCSFVIIGGNINNLPIAIKNFSFFTEKFAIEGDGLPYNHTIWTMINYFNINFGSYTIKDFGNNYISIYTQMVIISAIIIIAYLLIIEKEEWKIITILTIMMITFPHVSFDYTLIHLYIPLIYFIISNVKNRWEEIVYAILFSISILPMNYLETVKYNLTLNIGLALRPTILIIILGLIITTGCIQVIQNKKQLSKGKI